MEISLPNRWHPRPYQFGLWRYLENGGRRAVAVCHRRWGKDDLALHWTAVAAHQKVGTYWHMLPEYAQARRAIWDAVNPHTGIRRIDEAFPREIRESWNEQQMFIRFKNGSTWQVVGSDSYNSLVGSPPVGLVFSEWALADPSAWAYLRPILLENGGWALFIYTSRGRNHGYKTWNLSQQSEEWYGVRQNALETGVFTDKQLEAELIEYKSDYGDEDGEALFNQEYMCSFDAAVLGAYYGKIISRLDQDKRITSVPHDPQFPVATGWDLGIDDATAIWFVQIVGREIRVIDHMEARGRALTDIASEVLRKPYAYSEHYLPHDVETRELTSAKTRKETLETLGLHPIRAGSRLPVQDGINAARSMLSKCVFDARKCEKGLEALRSYRVEFDSKTKTPRKNPLHDWSSHSADAFRELAVQLFDHDESRKRNKQSIADLAYDPTASPDQWSGSRRLEDPNDPWAEPRLNQFRSGTDYQPF
jgi:phage terminase large subunit